MQKNRIYYLKLCRIYGIINFVTSQKGVWKYILNRKIKYYTKETIRLINIVAIALFIIMLIILFKFDLVCEVTINGESVGYIADKDEFEAKINEIINKEEDAK